MIRSTADPQLFFSFGAWRTRADIEAMRADAGVQVALDALRAACSEMTPGTYELVRHVRLEDRGSPA